MLFLKAIPTSGARLYDLRQAQTELTLSAKFQKLLPEKLQIYIFFFFSFYSSTCYDCLPVAYGFWSPFASRI